MNVLSDLIEYIEARKIRLIGRAENQAMKLYQGIRKASFSSDEAAMEALYRDNPYRATYYHSTKRKLRDLLYNTCLATVAKKEDYWEKLHWIEKKILVAQQLALQGQVHSAIRIMEEALAESEKLHVISSARQAAGKLSHWYAGIGDHARYKKYCELENQLWEKFQWERRAENYFFDLFDALRHQRGIDPAVIRKAGDYREELAKPLIDTFNFRMYAVYISVIYFELTNQGDRVLEACRQALEFFHCLPFELPNRTHRFFTVRMIPALLQQGCYREAVDQLNAAEDFVQKGTLNWAGMQEYKAIAGFHLQDLTIVADAIAAIRASRKVFLQKKEEVRVLEGYLAFLKAEEPSRFKVARFINDMPRFSTDKKGMNINILIIEILILLRRRKLSPIIDRMEALRTYTYRHLKDDPATRRPDLFIQLLLLVSRYSFELTAIREKAAPLLESLLQEPRHLQSIDIEIVPFEMLWQRIIEVLSTLYD